MIKKLPTIEEILSLKKKAVDMTYFGGGGHLGTTFSLAEIMTVLYKNILKVKPKEPSWENRDRLIMSKGHGCLPVYILLAEMGFFPKKELEFYCKPGGILAGHTTLGVPGVEASTGSLGHGLPISVGMAKAAKLDKKPWRVFTVLSDGDCQEGSTWEAAMAAGHHKLNNLTAIVDYNKYCSYEKISDFLSSFEPITDKFKDFGWSVKEVDGHNVKEIFDMLSKTPFEKNKPSVVIAHTVKGNGVQWLIDRPNPHYKSLKEEEYEIILSQLK